MSGFDIEQQLGSDEMEDKKAPDSSPPSPVEDDEDEASSETRTCWSSVSPILGKAALGLVVVVGVIVVAIPFGAFLLALMVSVSAPLLALSGAMFAIGAALLVGMPVIIPLLYILMFSLPKKTLERIMGRVDKKPAKEAQLDAGMGGLYNLARRKESLSDRIMMGSFGVIARISLGALVWLGLSLLQPRLRLLTILGSPMWKWSLLGVTLTAGYFQVLTFVVPAALFWPSGWAASYYLKALYISINHVAYFGLVLGTWLGYFRTHHGLNHPHRTNHKAFEYVTWTFVSLSVGSILMLFKNLLLLKWGADAILRRFEPRILITSLKFYFIGRLAAGFDQMNIVRDLGVLDLYGSESDELSQEGDPTDGGVVVVKRTAVSKYVLSKKMSLSHLVYVSRILISLGETMSTMLLDHEQGDHEDEVVTWLRQKIKDDYTSVTCTADGLVELFHKQEETNPSSHKGGVIEPPESPKADDKSLELAKGNVEPPELQKGDIEPPELQKGDIEPPELQKGDVEPPELEKEGVEPPELPKGDVEKSKLPFWMKIWKSMLDEEDSEVKAKTKSEILQEKNKKLANILLRLIGEECSSAHPFTFDHLKIWMVDAHKDCINMGRTLADAKAIVTRLDIFMSFVIFVIVLLLWLLITGVSSTTVLVTVATPFLALTFVFGDSAKTFFQGLIFCFATHPYDVGDRCILDEVELEVKSVSILTTTFIKIGSNEKRLYPNSVLATKAIINLGWQPDPKDVVELPLNPSTNLDALKKKIAEFFEEENNRFGNKYSLMISEVGENIKVKIQYSHILTVHDLSHSQCFKKKNSQRSDFLIKKYVNESRIERTDARDPSQFVASTSTDVKELMIASVDKQK